MFSCPAITGQPYPESAGWPQWRGQYIVLV